MKSDINKNDKRVMKTRRILRESLIKLLEQKALSEITVKELTELAEVNRSTFYFYYDDIYDMMQKYQDEVYESFERDTVPSNEDIINLDSYIRYCKKFIDFCAENSSLCLFLLKNDRNNQLIVKIKNAVRENIPDSLGIFPEDDPRRYLSDFALAGIIEVILKWMEEGMKVPSEELAEFVSRAYFSGGSSLKAQKSEKNSRQN